MGSKPLETFQKGLSLLRHKRGNLETDLYGNLNWNTESGEGRRRITVKRKARRMLLGILIEHSTQRWGKPTTGGRT